MPNSTRSELPSKGSPSSVRPPDTPDDLDRDATAADLRPGNVVAYMVRAHARGDRRAVTGHRQYLRRCGFSITIGKVDAREDAGPLGFAFDQMLRALAAADFRMASVHRRSLAKAGVNVAPIVAKAKGGA